MGVLLVVRKVEDWPRDARYTAVAIGRRLGYDARTGFNASHSTLASFSRLQCHASSLWSEGTIA